MVERKPILCLDFDGVLHSYSSGWKGPRNIPDPPVPGAIEWLRHALYYFDVQILSSRSHYWFGRAAMRRWLILHMTEWLDSHVQRGWPPLPGIDLDWGEPYDDALRHAAESVVRLVGFPLHKPPAMVTLDDRAIQFTGDWPSIESLLAFKPWHNRKKRAE